MADGFVQQNARPSRTQDHFHFARRGLARLELHNRLPRRFLGEMFRRAFAGEKLQAHAPAAAARAGLKIAAVLGDGEDIEAHQRLEIRHHPAVRTGDQHVANLVAVSGPHLLDARVVGARGNVRPHHQGKLVGQITIRGGQDHRIEIVVGVQRAQAHGGDARRAAGDARRNFRGLQNLFRGQVVRVGVAGLLPRHHANAAAHGDAFGGGFHQRLIHEQR